MQYHFLETLEVTTCDAFLNFNFAPLAIRRRISVLGLLFKITIEKCHPGFREIFQSSPVSVYRSSHNFRKALHDYQLSDLCTGRQSDLVDRSIFGLVRVFNALPKYCLETNSVSTFQKRCTDIVREKCMKGDPKWHQNFHRKVCI